ncbi:YihA family ribosome biogenesis GTP-binding protein [Pseudoalteromonas sp. McH1-7]|uniref:Probable GTP-binding protein EngB n=1 Tax=Pseudoalteromonas peptidolytica F12-50-A1 TaxID=1315280 RepID=A0A8I0T682_9GAMM|nr:ribosome biogenesis GTP-binding protein YihA/YsxC [Pseudoalteromonas peptidolytica]NUZ12143.1 YihA family ribosome biogenesis GTP-binding protein [Pseudoalteromonas sp. McH1-7]MBE0348167.1 GTP-binding protein [Pseudoalteromonas peptidolytica F12-50-A1]MDW7550918.1 ribosome biogenesis GTP-binding protein YihA/YsxC [Pseudoalteromonas peptidolytica]NLR15492.1 YihA family ribosome biogenesis GTP-binding protein [Pseudoalteromonas peptidolytica]GEK11405.1 putative GTP-binding protein EngB [Pseud
MLKSRVKYNQAQFITSAPDISKLPPDTGIEVAFAGRSNAGKSSALNTLTDQKLARTSKTPGRTQLINTFSLGEDQRLIDLPGYGFAKVPLEMKKKWQKALGEYLQRRKCLKGIVVLMDIRHPLKDLDMDLINWAISSNIPVLALLTKADKLKQGKRKAEVLQVRRALAELNGDITVHAFSSLKGIGLNELAWKLDEWYLGPFVKDKTEATE